MRKASIAEWILRRVTTRERASAIVGDLVEGETGLGRRQFWIAVSRIVFSMVWRPVLGLALAYFAGMISFGYLQNAVFGINLPGDHRAVGRWINLLSILAVAGVFLWFQAAFSLIAYGWRDVLTKFAAASALIITVVIFFWWQPGILAASVLASAAGALMWKRQPDRWKVAAVALLTVSTGILGGLIVAALDTLYTKVLLSHRFVGSDEMVQHPSLVWVASSLVAILAIVTARVCAIGHAWQAKGPNGILRLQ